MQIDPKMLAEQISCETGLRFTGREGRDGEQAQWYEIKPADHPSGQTFSIRTTVGWRRIEVSFSLGNFAADLLTAMGTADRAGQLTFVSVLDRCVADDAEIDFIVNGEQRSYSDPSVWSPNWRSMSLRIKRGMLAINDGDTQQDRQIIQTWSLRAAASILGLLPVEQEAPHVEGMLPDGEGLPEGALVRVEVNRYERDRRNRAAALAIHGYSCLVCGLMMNTRYGDAAAGLIEVHHVTRVSELGADYVVDPRNDLVPLCPNCHSVAHRRSPPYTVQELRQILST